MLALATRTRELVVGYKHYGDEQTKEVRSKDRDDLFRSGKAWLGCGADQTTRKAFHCAALAQVRGETRVGRNDDGEDIERRNQGVKAIKVLIGVDDTRLN